MVHPEHRMEVAYVQLDPAYRNLKAALLQYAQRHLAAMSGGVRTLKIHIHDADDEFQRIAAKMGYEKTDKCEEMCRMTLGDQLPRPPMPPGFQLRSLADDNDLRKVHRVLWRGFNHEGEPPEEGVAEREFMQSAPNFRKELNIVVHEPAGNFVSYCGMWFEAQHRIAYVEPVATDPDFRRMGLGKAAVVEGIRRCRDEGATVAYVGTAMPFYLSMGFRRMYRMSVWQRRW
jgi:GNAT superfamily N-acetyltransferase